MQALWSRAAQARSSCRCPSCLSPKSVTRPSSGARSIRSNRSSNIILWYSTIISTTAALDATYKNSRRKDIDDAILKAKEEVDTLDEYQQMRLQALGSDRVGELTVLQNAASERRNSFSSETTRIWRPFKIADPVSTPFMIPKLGRTQAIANDTEAKPRITDPSGKVDTESRHQRAREPKILDRPSLALDKEILEVQDQHNLTFLRNRGPSSSVAQKPQGSKLANELEREILHSDGRRVVKVKKARKEPMKDDSNTDMPESPKASSGRNYLKNLRRESQTAHTHHDHLSATETTQKWGTKTRRGRLGDPSLSPEKRSKHALIYYGGVDAVGISQAALARILLDSKPLNPHKGRPFEAVWASSSTPVLDWRNLLLRQAVVAELIYKLTSHHFSVTGHLGKKPKSGVRIRLPDDNFLEISKSESSSVCERIEKILHHQRTISTAKLDQGLLSLIEPLPFPRYNWNEKRDRDQELAGSATQEEELLQFFSEPRSLDSVLPDLCSLLARQRFAPNIHVFNILIIRLCHLQLHHAAAVVISVLQHSGIVQNEVTHAAVLECFACCGNHKKFVAYLNLMEGIPGKTLSPANRAGPSFLSRRSPESLVTAHQNQKHAVDGFHDPKRQVQWFKAARCQETYEVIVTGFLRFLDTESALEEYSKMIRSGFTPAMRIYNAFLRHCVRTKAWILGEIIWQKIKDSSIRIPALTYYWMLQLCAFCRKPHLFDMVVQDAIRDGALQFPLDIDHFRWNSTTFQETLSNAYDIDRFETFLKVPGMESIDDQDMRDSGALHPCPANLATFTKQSYMRQVCRNEKAHGFCLDVKLRPHYESSAFVQPQITQWVELDAKIGKPVLTSDSQWPGTSKPGNPKPKLLGTRNPEYLALQLADDRAQSTSSSDPKRRYRYTFNFSSKEKVQEELEWVDEEEEEKSMQGYGA